VVAVLHSPQNRTEPPGGKPCPQLCVGDRGGRVRTRVCCRAGTRNYASPVATGFVRQRLGLGAVEEVLAGLIERLMLGDFQLPAQGGGQHSLNNHARHAV
jgi:hypothetical protein